MSTTKAPNYRNFLEYGGRTPSKPLNMHRTGMIGCTSKSRNQDIAAKVMLKGESPMALVIECMGAANWIVSRKESLVGWIASKTSDIILHSVYSAGGRTTVQPLESSSDFGHLRNKIRGFQQLARGWDSYAAEAPSSRAVSAALQLVVELEHAEILPEWVAPTSDSSILMRYRHGDVWYDWEFHSDGDVAVMRKPLFDKETYHDFGADDIDSFFSAQYSAQ